MSESFCNPPYRGTGKDLPSRSKSRHFRWPASAMNHYNSGNVKKSFCNRIIEPCFMCLNPNIDLKTIRQYEIEIEDLKNQILALKNSDSCYRALDKLPKIPQKIKMLEKNETYKTYEKTLILYQEKVQFITMTFDPHKFKTLTNRQAQRNYMQYVIEKVEPIGPFYGCFELHENGVVHSHFMINKFNEKEFNEMKSWLTNFNNNIYALHQCEKTYTDAFDYINKPETKDKNAIFNFYKNL